VTLKTAIKTYNDQHIKVFLCALQPDVYEMCERFDLFTMFNTQKVYPNVLEAIDALIGDSKTKIEKKVKIKIE
jgi:anti-anti-sigma regulatory factor